MIRKAHRLPIILLPIVRKDGKVLFFQLHNSILKDNDVDRFRYCIIVSKKVAKMAVDRNKIKRRIYHALSEIRSAELLKGVDMIIVAQSSILESSYQQIKDSLEKSMSVYKSKK